MNAAVNAVAWVVGKALAPVMDTVLEAWAASKDLGPNVEALKMELLYVQAMLRPTLCRRQEMDNPPLELVLQKLRDLAHDAEDVLDELDYFRIQDQLDGTSEAADDGNTKGCCHSLVLNARSTAKAVCKRLLCSCSSTCCSATSAPPHTSTSSHPDYQRVNGRMPKFLSGACSTVRHVGKRLPCSSCLLPVNGDGDHSGTLIPRRASIQETPKLSFNRVDISSRMRLIVEHLRPMRQEVSKILATLGSIWSTIPDISQSRPITTSESIEPRLYGRDDIMNGIIHDIIQGKYCDEDLTVLPIVGIGGIGKTSLAQHIYHHQQVQKHFEVMIWKCVSLNFNVNKLTEDIAKYIPEVEYEKKGTAEELIGQRLKSKRFFLVLDDMWEFGDDEDEWKRLLLPFKKSQAKGNLIIVTTRSSKLAEMVKTTHHHPIVLEGIEREEFKSLFLAFVFGNEQPRQDHTLLLETGYKIMDKLRGSPLAAKTVGRLLGNDLDLDHWTRVLESKEWESQRGKHDIMPALKLSYDYLPFNLQQCFAYCALFPQDYKFDSQELILFWIGQDLLHFGNQNNSSAEDIGMRNIKDLVSHGFFKKDEVEGQCPCYSIHDLLHDLALEVTSHECLNVNISSKLIGNIRPSVRHLSITTLDSTDDGDDKMIEENITSGLRKISSTLKVGNLQSFMVFGRMGESFNSTFNDLFGELNALRLLCLPNVTCPMESVLRDFSTAVHLRYLRLGTTYIVHSRLNLPIILPRCYHLKILDIREWCICEDLPRGMSNLLNLCHFLTTQDKHYSNISSVGKLQFLQELKAFQLNRESNGFELKQLGNLTELRELGIYDLEKIQTKEEATEAKMIDKKFLRKLTLVWDKERPNIEHVEEAMVLESLRPHRRLHELCIREHGARSYPTWLGDHISSGALQSLHLDGIAWEVFPPLGRMWLLQELTLENVPTVKEFGPGHFGSITEQSFHKLKRLVLIGLQQIEKWDLGDTCHLLLQLQVLIIRDCPKLLGLPFDNIFYPKSHDLEGKIQWFPNLQVLEINNCPKLMRLPPIPWTQTLCLVRISDLGSMLPYSLNYSKSRSELHLEISGDNYLHSLGEQIFVLNNLTHLKGLLITNCPPLELKHMQMLTSLNRRFCSSPTVPSASEGEVKWQLPIEDLYVSKCGANGKELTEFISHFPKLSDLFITDCESITRICVVLEQQEQAANAWSPSSSAAVTMDDVQAVCHEWQIAVEVEDEEEIDGGLLIFPVHLRDSLRVLRIWFCPKLSLVSSPFCIDYKRVGGRGGEGGWLQALHYLKELDISGCPNFLSAFEASCSSSCCPFPSSLQTLRLRGAEGMGTLAPLSNLSSLTRLEITLCGEGLRSLGLWVLIFQGQLRNLTVLGTPNFFVGSDPMRELKGDYQEHLLRGSSKLSYLETDSIAFLTAPICSILSSSLIYFKIVDILEVQRFTKEQEEALQLLTSLKTLRFGNMVKLQCLPAGLHRLHNLERLDIRSCPDISSLPEDGLPLSLRTLGLDIRGKRRLLIERCKSYIQSHPQIKINII